MSMLGVLDPGLQSIHHKLNKTHLYTYVLRAEKYEYDLERMLREMDQLKIVYRRSCEEELWKFLFFRDKKYPIKSNMTKERHFIGWFLRRKFFQTADEVLQDPEAQACLNFRNLNVARHNALKQSVKELKQKIIIFDKEKSSAIKKIDFILSCELKSCERSYLESRNAFFSRVKLFMDIENASQNEYI